MKNKVELKKAIILSILIALIAGGIFWYVNYIEYKAYTVRCNEKIDIIVGKINKEYPDISKDDIIKILNDEESLPSNVLKEYGIDLNKDSYILENDNSFKTYLILELIVFTSLVLRLKFDIFDIQLQKR